jgi:hypothetical protein
MADDPEEITNEKISASLSELAFRLRKDMDAAAVFIVVVDGVTDAAVLGGSTRGDDKAAVQEEAAGIFYRIADDLTTSASISIERESRRRKRHS